MLQPFESTRNRPRSALAWTAVVAALVGAAGGCQSPNAPFDPFMAGRTTIPPPSTAAAPAAAAPYYPADGGSTPATIYTPPGSTPAAVPATQNYLPRGGMSFPQSQTSPTPNSATLASSSPATGSPSGVAASPNGQPPAIAIDRSVKPASFHQPLSAPSGEATPATARTIPVGAPIRLPANSAAQPLASSLRSAEGRAAVAQLPELGDFPRPSPRTSGDFRAGGPASATSGAVAQPISPTQSSAAGQPAPSAAVPGYGYDEKYQRLQGKLEFSPSQQRWKLRYIPIDGETDSYGGSVVLPESDKLQGLAAGDFVVLQGRLKQSQGAPEGFSPPYLIERVVRQ